MTAATPDRAERGHSAAADRLREALGWDRLPEMTPQQREAYEAANRRARHEARRFYHHNIAVSEAAYDDDVDGM
jgi:hypothetical protein